MDTAPVVYILQNDQFTTFWTLGPPKMRPMTLKFEVVRDFDTVHLPTMFQHPTFNHSEVIMLRNKETHTHTPHSAMLHWWRTNKAIVDSRLHPCVQLSVSTCWSALLSRIVWTVCCYAYHVLLPLRNTHDVR